METIEALRQQRIDEARLRERWSAEARVRPFYPYPHICDKGLLLGVATQIAKMEHDRKGRACLKIEGQEERILALLSLAYEKAVPAGAIKYIKRSSMQWAKGEKVLAHFELAFARLPRFEARDETFPLFRANGLLANGVAPRSLLRYRGIDAVELDLLKYSPDQPRVPAGSGREGGRWTSGDDGDGAQASIPQTARPSGEIISDVLSDPVRSGQ